jgi:diacylglycerol O-acyltransferase
VDAINLLDAGFLHLETPDTPMHVAGLNLLEFPKGANSQKFMARLGDGYRSTTELRKPFAHIATTGMLGRFGPLYWEPDPDIDLDYHVRHTALPKPGRYRELFALVSHLHSTLLDRSRPLWEAHLIEGLQNRQFAVYTKLHHATVDGVAGARMTEAACSADPNATTDLSPLSIEAHERYKASRGYAPRADVEPTQGAVRHVSTLPRPDQEIRRDLAWFRRWPGRTVAAYTSHRHQHAGLGGATFRRPVLEHRSHTSR